ncbi:PH domain-containing protein [candidate division KSB1 bacterium]
MEIKPDQSLLKVWRIIMWLNYLPTTFLPIILLFIIQIVENPGPYAPFSREYIGFSIAIIVIFVVLTAIMGFTNFWMTKYFHRLTYKIGEGAVSIDKGVWWVQHKEIPFDKIVGVSSKQGPLERMYGIGKVTIQTAGFGQVNMPEGILLGIPNMDEIRGKIVEKMETKTKKKDID